MIRMVPRLLLLFVLLALATTANAQWECVYSTWDEETNGTGNQTSSVGVISENTFVAMVTYSGQNAFMIPYVNADSMMGRLYSYGYGSSATDGVREVWTDGGFDQLQFLDAWHIKAAADSFLYIANNDPNHNVLVYRLIGDTVQVVASDPGGTVFPRVETGVNSIFGIEVDGNGYVYVGNDTTTGKTDDIKVYPPISQWSAFHTDAPMTTIDLPDGIYRGLGVSPDGSSIYVADLTNRKVWRFTGSPQSGYTLNPGFNFELTDADSIPGLPGVTTQPVGLAYLSPNNILAVACSRFSYTYSGSYCAYARIYLLNASTGELISANPSEAIVDQAAWNLAMTGGYTDRSGGTFGTASGYGSTYDVAWDENKNLYSVSYWGWTVEKWKFNGTLPTFPMTDVAESPADVPSSFTLSQNYPNPFNPATTIEFTVPETEKVTLRVFDMLGRQVATLVDGVREAGVHRVVFEPRAVPSGTYIYELRAGTFRAAQRMMLLK